MKHQHSLRTIAITVCMLTLFVMMALSSPYSSEFTVSKKFCEAGRRTVIFDRSNPNSSFHYYISLEGPTYYCFSAISIADLEMQVTNTIDVSAEFVSCLSYNRNGYYNYNGPSFWWNEKYNRMSVAIKTTQPTSIKKLVISYLVHLNPYYYFNYFQYRSFSVNSFISKNVTLGAFQINYQNYYYYYYDYYNSYNYYFVNAETTALIFLNGLRAMSNDTSLTYSLYFTSEIISPNYYTKTVKVYLKSNSQIPTYIESIAFTVFLYFANFRNHFSIYVDIYGGSISSTNTNSLQSALHEHIMESFNTFIGLSSFHIFNQQTFSLFSSILDRNTILVTSNSFFKEISVSYIILYSRWCSHNAPYYQIYYSQACFKQCPLCTYKGSCQYNENETDDYKGDQFICNGQYLSCYRVNNYADCILTANQSIAVNSSYKQFVLLASIITFVLLTVIIRTYIAQKKKMNQANSLKSKQALQTHSPEKQGTEKQLKREDQLKQQQFPGSQMDIINQ